MSKPSEEMKIALRRYLASTNGSSEWLAMVRWILVELACDQEYLSTLLFDELERRKRREAETSSDSQHMLSIMKDLKLRIVPEGMR